MSYCIVNKQNDELMESILHSFSENKSITNLNISGNVLSLNAMKYLYIAINTNNNITHYNIKDVDINEEYFDLIQNALSSAIHDNISELQINLASENNLQPLLNSLSKHKSLQTLC